MEELQFEIRSDPDGGRGGFAFTRIYALTPSGSRIQVYAESKLGEHSDSDISERWAEKQIDAFKTTDQKCFQAYCRGQSKAHDALSFLDWVEGQGFTFSDCFGFHRFAKDAVEFHGNLEEYSSAFSFMIFDEALLGRIKRRVRKIQARARLTIKEQ